MLLPRLVLIALLNRAAGPCRGAHHPPPPAFYSSSLVSVVWPPLSCLVPQQLRAQLLADVGAAGERCFRRSV